MAYIQKRIKIPVKDINSLLHEIIMESGGYTDSELLVICNIRLEEEFELDNSVLGIYGIYDPIEKRKELNPPKRLGHRLDKKVMNELFPKGIQHEMHDQIYDVLSDVITERMKDMDEVGYNDHFCDMESDFISTFIHKNLKFTISFD